MLLENFIANYTMNLPYKNSATTEDELNFERGRESFRIL